MADAQNTAAFWLSPQQKHICSLRSDASAYRVACWVELTGRIEHHAMRRAVREVTSQHDILRTVFRRQPGMKVPFQLILPTCEPTYEVVDLASCDEAAQNRSMDELWHRELNRDFDLENGPLLAVTLISLGPNKSALFAALPAVCSDAKSLQVLVTEICKAYSDGQIHGDEALRYVQFAQWANDLLESDEDAAREGREFWKQQSGLATPALPQEIRAEQRESLSREPLTLTLPDEVRAEIEAAAANHETNIANVILAAWQCLFWRLTAEPVFSVGVLLDGREYEELGSALGVFARMVPLAGRFDGDFRFRDVVTRIANSLQQSIEWQEYYRPGEAFEKEAAIAFEFGERPPAKTFSNVTLTWLRQYSCIDSFKLKLVAVRSGPELTLEFHYDSARLSRAAVEQIAGCFHTLLAAAVAQPEVAVSRLPLLNQAEQQRLLVDWNQTAAPYPNLCLHQLFETQAERTPDRPAVRFNQQVLSYRQLNQRANHLAHWLRRQGVGPDSLVGLCLERSADMIVALLGILKAGGAYVPLNPDNPKLRLAQQLTGAVALVTEQALLSRLPDFPGSTLCLDRDEHSWTEEPSDNPELNCTPDNLVYVIFTSGSTGVPKGVAVRHRNLVNYTHFITQLLQLERYPEGLQFATVSTLGADLGNTSIFPALVSGGCLHVIGYEVATDPQRLARYAEQYPMDVLKIVPSHLAALLNASDAGQLLPRRYLITGGETLTRTLVEKIASLHSSCELINHYGPTETTVGSLTLRVKQDASHLSETIPIGRPIANTQVYILDGQQQPVPVGVVGELYIAGAGVTAGYLNQPERTAERFLTNRFVNQPGARMYRTGDRARYLPDGTVEFLGRNDDQVKIRGFRIELGEIEALLTHHPAIKQAVVLARADEGQDKRLVAYVVVRQDQPVSSDQLKKYLEEHVPDYMVPAAIVPLSKLPLTSNGKIERQALPAPEQVQAKAYVAPRTPTEAALAAIWGEVLRRDRISVDDNFFQLGGHSLLATQVISRVREQFQVELAIRVLFETPTIAALGEAIQAAQDAGSSAASSIMRVSREAYRARS